MSKERDKVPPIVSLVNLGCAKNTVDSERILGMFICDGWLVAHNPADADICLVNTCGFIGDAREETREVLTEMREMTKKSRLKVVVALGCMVERAANVPEEACFLEGVNLRIGFSDYPRIVAICRERLFPKNPAMPAVAFPPFSSQPRAKSGFIHTAHLKISEGCSNHCSFCTIPAIRGTQVSRPIEEIVAEVNDMIATGTNEIEIIAQDTTSYGKDLYDRYALPELMEELAKNYPNAWFRLMYTYPPRLTDDILDILAAGAPFCPYIDLPLQHISDDILKSMGRKMRRADIIELLDKIKVKIPHAVIRTTFITGYPGESKAHFNELLDFVKEGRFLHVGVFTYSHELKTAAYRMEDNIPPEEKERRKNLLMEAQIPISSGILKKYHGKRITITIDCVADNFEMTDGYEDDQINWRGHTNWQSPDVDGGVLLRHQNPDVEIVPGERIEVEVTGNLSYDLIATTCISAN